ncbi:hypothetical protein KPSA1_02575 [Pseudomonas syringae pv. actinidiae]|uniref:Uncharacterized protein n=1 Tax=Pseudomonas syringae pv. actinidiae TaxID=103796 RepID=A0A2V0Q8V7_PSESF|nr:hypothetical protein KPSA1_02575 [Pseudomonas syringae pv. actinidiae]GBH16901.1 hypothetical protein KPSA3_02859 [Pseudomonas syringae pv. actinidiae]
MNIAVHFSTDITCQTPYFIGVFAQLISLDQRVWRRQSVNHRPRRLSLPRKLRISQQRLKPLLVQRAVWLQNAKTGEVDHAVGRSTAKRETASHVLTAGDKHAAVTGRAAEVGHGPAIDHDRWKACDYHCSAGADVADSCCAQGVDQDII